MTDTIPNRGDAGAVLDASVAGLVRVEGPAIWSSGAAGAITPATPADGGTLITSDLRVAFARGTGANYCTVLGGGSTTPEIRISTGGQVQGRLDDAPSPQSALGEVPVPGVLTLFRATFDGVRITAWSKPVGGDIDADLRDDNGWVAGNTSADRVSGLPTINLQMAVIRSSSGSELAVHSAYGRVETTNGTQVLDLRATDIADTAPDAAQILPASGMSPLNVTRASSGPVATIVPSGVEYINPDDGNQANSVLVPGDVALDIPAGEDGVIFWAGRISNLGNTFVFLVEYGLTGDARIGMLLSSSLLEARLDIRTTDGASSTAATYIEVGQDDLVVLALVMDRSTDLARWRSYTQAGLLDSTDRSISDVVGSIDGSLGGRILSRIPGTVSSFLFDRGVGVAPSDEEVAAMAAALIAQMQRDPISSTGALPPAGHKVRGDRYRANNGHTAQFNGASWDAVTPAVGNLAALLGNNQLLLGAS